MSKLVLETRREVMREVAKQFPGGQDCAAAKLGIKPKRLENQVYETAGCTPLSDSEIHALEQVSGTHHLPDYICRMYGGAFMPLPVVDDLDSVELHTRSVDVAAKRGRLDVLIAEALADGLVTSGEAAVIRAALASYQAAHASELHATMILFGEKA